ncbi:hypothetical protein [Arabiibacter massiliensis]|uniref:hypothetical protein n=1 Tax=Arabiibacter massiliensis TaxID=1870985 RepID=UPI0009BB9CD5|nr:hypothetical protein [Arabiibacter massiliensis]
MEGYANTQRKTARAGLAALAALMLAAMLGLAACAGGGAGAGGSDVSTEDRTNAKQVIMAAGDLFTMMDLGLTDADSPATITQDDPAYAEFFDKLLQYKKVADLDVKDASLTVSIQAVKASTAREDSQQTNYRFAVTDASMTVNGSPIAYSADKGFSKN